MRHYLDHNATSPLRPVARDAMVAAMELVGNPSSIHAEGRLARKLLDDAREKLGFALGCLPQMISFTSGGTEANTMALRGVAANRLIVSAIEHPSVLESAKASGKPLALLPVDRQGVVDLDELARKLKEGPGALVSVMLANNETGVVQPIAEIAALVKSAGGLLHVDAVQGFGKIKVNFGLLGCDLMTVAAHKVGGPVGIGALVVRDGLAVLPLLVGGGQELRRRAGTENILAAAGFAAVSESMLNFNELRGDLESSLEAVEVIGAKAHRLPNTSCFGVAGLTAETLLMALDLEGFAVSSGSACSSGKVGRSHVLEAMGVPSEISKSALRVSLGWNTTRSDITSFASTFNAIAARQRARKAA